MFEELVQNVGDSKPMRPAPMTSDGLLGLFSADTTGRDYVLQPASLADMCGGVVLEKQTLEVVYDEA
jgi:chlorophyllide a reductase subunit X